MALDSFLVSIGIKGQDAVLKTIDKVKKQGDKLSKGQLTLDFGKGLKKSISSSRTGGSVPSIPDLTGQPPSPAQKETEKKNSTIADKFNRAAGTIGNASVRFAQSAASLDPVSMIQGVTSAAAKIAGGWSVFGFSAQGATEGLGDLMNAGVSMASGAVDSAKRSAAGQYGLSTRNAMTSYYGGDRIAQRSMSNAERAELVASIAGSYGRIKKPMQDAINSLSGSKDTGALARVASGDWRSTGTDKGWINQLITDSMGDLPPSIKQRMQAMLLAKSGASEIMGNEGQVGAQASNAKWQNKDEAQMSAMYQLSIKNKDTIKALEDLNTAFYAIQTKLVSSGGTLASVVDKMATAVNSAVTKMGGK